MSGKDHRTLGLANHLGCLLELGGVPHGVGVVSRDVHRLGVLELRKLLLEIRDLQESKKPEPTDREKLKDKLKQLEPYQKGEWLHRDGTPNYPRDLTLGQYKAGGEPEQLYVRIMLGIPGTPMPASSNQPQAEIFALIHFLRTLPSEK